MTYLQPEVRHRIDVLFDGGEPDRKLNLSNNQQLEREGRARPLPSLAKLRSPLLGTERASLQRAGASPTSLYKTITRQDVSYSSPFIAEPRLHGVGLPEDAGDDVARVIELELNEVVAVLYRHHIS